MKFLKAQSSIGSVFAATTLFLAATASVVACSDSANADPVIGSPTLKFDKAAFRAKLEEALAFPNAKGYAALILKDGQLVDEVGSGYAWISETGSGEAMFTPNTPTNIGSTMKLVSWVMLLEVFQNKKEKTVDQWLDTPIYTSLPGQWRDFVAKSPAVEHQNIKKVTFRMLMQHKSGFRVPPNKKVMFDYIQAGIKSADMGVRDYENANATVITYLLPQLIDATWAENVRTQAVQNKIANNAAWYVEAYSKYLQKHMRTKFFNRVKPEAINPSCEPYPDYVLKGIVPAYSYDTPLGGYNPQLTGSKVKDQGCHTMGGWYFTTRELGKFLATFNATETFLTNATKAKMYDDSSATSRDNRLGWSQVMASGFITQHFKVNAVPYHGGDDLNYHTAIVKFPAGYMGVISTNYVTGENSHNLAQHIKNAWAAGLAANYQ